MDPTLEGVLTVAGAAPVIALLNGAILRAAGPDFNASRWGPLLALLLGVVVVLLATLALGLGNAQGVGQAILTGLVAGAAAIGLYETVNGTVLGR